MPRMKIKRDHWQNGSYTGDIDGCKYFNFTACFHTYEDRTVDVSDLYSTMRKRVLAAGDYLDRYYDSSDECSRKSE